VIFFCVYDQNKFKLNVNGNLFLRATSSTFTTIIIANKNTHRRVSVTPHHNCVTSVCLLQWPSRCLSAQRKNKGHGTTGTVRHGANEYYLSLRSYYAISVTATRFTCQCMHMWIIGIYTESLRAFHEPTACLDRTHGVFCVHLFNCTRDYLLDTVGGSFSITFCNGKRYVSRENRSYEQAQFK